MIVAHGTGGLLAFAALAEVGHLVYSCIFVGTPFGPAVYEPLRSLHEKHPVKEYRKVLNPATLFTHPSAFVGLPTDNSATLWDDVGWLVNDSGRRIKVDLFAAQDWESRKLGPFADGAVFGEQV